MEILYSPRLGIDQGQQWIIDPRPEGANLVKSRNVLLVRTQRGINRKSIVFDERTTGPFADREMKLSKSRELELVNDREYNIPQLRPKQALP